MRLSELIAALEDLKGLHGDIKVMALDYALAHIHDYFNDPASPRVTIMDSKHRYELPSWDEGKEDTEKIVVI